MQPLPPVRVRLHPDDHEQYGGDWYVYDESALIRMPVRDLIAIEAEIGTGILAMMAAARMLDSPRWTAATLAQIWIARRMSGITEPYAEFSPLVPLSTWEPVPADDVDPPDLPGSTSPPQA